MDYAASKAEQLQHLIAMARLPGAKAQAWHSAKELAKLHADFEDLPALLTDAMNREAADAPRSPD